MPHSPHHVLTTGLPHPQSILQIVAKVFSTCKSDCFTYLLKILTLHSHKIKFKCLSLSFIMWLCLPSTIVLQHTLCWINSPVFCHVPLWLYPNYSVAGMACPDLSPSFMWYSAGKFMLFRFSSMSPLCETIPAFLSSIVTSFLSQQLVHLSIIRLINQCSD